MSSTGEGREPEKGRAYGVPARRVWITQLLTEAYARDDLEEAEFERRIERAEQSSTIEELDALVADFPSELVRAAGAQRAAGTPAVPHSGAPITGSELENEVARLNTFVPPMRLNLIGDQRIALGPGDPPAIQSISLIGDTQVDLRPLAGSSGVVLVKIAAALGDTRIVVTPGTAVDLRLVTLLGDQKHTLRGSNRWRKLARKLGADFSAEATAPGPTVVVTGLKLLGDTEVVEA